MPKMKIEFQVSDAFVNAILSQAVEGGSGYWAKFGAFKTDRSGNLSNVRVYEYGDEAEPVSDHRIGVMKMREGVRRVVTQDFNLPDSHAGISSEVSSDLYRALISTPGGNTGYIDSEIADAVLQCACFGHIIYG